MSRSPHLRRAIVCAIAATSLLAAAPASSPAAARDVTVMTRNLYLGSDVINLAVAPDIPTLSQAIKTNLELVRANDFRIRAKAIANEIRATKPDLVGLQEVAEWRRGAQGVQDNDI